MISNKINLSVYISSLFLIISGGCYAQSLKSYNGSFANGSNQTGQATYSYYEDSKTKEYIKQGAFRYSLVGKDDKKGLKHTISGNYEKGLKHGIWTYKVVMNDYFMGYYHSTGNITLTANYKNGLADGSWKYSSKTKTRLYSRYTGWGPYNPENIINTSMNFRKGRIVGNVTINEVGVLKVNGNYDQNSFSTGTWKMDFLDKNQTFEITFKDKFMTDFIGRNGSGQILDGSTSLNPELNAERNQRYLDLKGASLEELENAGYDLDTVCHNSVPTKYIQDYFKYMMNSDWFLYKYITGDLTFERYKKYSPNSISGGCNIVIEKVNFVMLSDIRAFNKAEEFFNSGLYMDAFNSYFETKSYIRTYSGRYKKSDLKRLDEQFKISFEKADSLSKILLSKDDVWALERNLSARKEEEKNEIRASLKTQNMDFYRPYQAGAINNLSSLLVSDVMNNVNPDTEIFNKWTGATTIVSGEEEMADFNPKQFADHNASSSDKKVYYLNYNKDSVIIGLNALLDKCLQQNRNLLLISQQFEAKTKQIEELNLTTKTKLIYVTYTAVMDDFKSRYTEERYFSDNRPIDDYLKLITLLNLSLEKIIELYNVDPKTMDKALKKAVSPKAKNELLFPLLSFRTDGALEGLYDL